MGAFEWLTGRSEYSYLGMNEIYETCAQPVGAVNGSYARLANGVYFLDEEGNDLFGNFFVDKIKNRRDGTITVISTPDPESYQRDVDKVAQIWFFVQEYEVLEGQGVSLTLS